MAKGKSNTKGMRALARHRAMTKKLQKQGMSYRTAQKNASAAMKRGGTRSKPKKKSGTKKKKTGSLTTRSRSHTDKNKFKDVNIQVGGLTVSQLMSRAKGKLLDEIGNKRARLYQATVSKAKAKVKNGLRKQLSKLESSYRKLS